MQYTNGPLSVVRVLGTLARCTLSPEWDTSATMCSWCGGPAAENRHGSLWFWCSNFCQSRFWANHMYKDARAAVLKMSEGLCARCGIKYHDDELQCNHIVPVRGQRSSPSCQNHLANLEMVCQPCHVVITFEQDLAQGFRRMWKTNGEGIIKQQELDIIYGGTPLFSEAVREHNDRVLTDKPYLLDKSA